MQDDKGQLKDDQGAGSVHTLPAVSEQCSLAGDSQMMRSMQKKQKRQKRTKGKKSTKGGQKKQQVDKRQTKHLRTRNMM